MRTHHWIITVISIVVLLYLGKMFGSKLPAIPGLSGT